MNRNKLFSFVAAVMLVATACMPEEYNLGSKDVAPSELVEGIAFTITHDPNNQNIVYLESKMKGYSPLWIHPQGRSQDHSVTLRVAFAGSYEVTFGVQTRGGYVFSQPVSFTINQMNTDFIDDPMWTMLSGGVGNQKTWYLDLDADGVCRYFGGPLFFAHPEDGRDEDGNFTTNWEPGGTNQMPARDYGSMTFDLIDGANVTVEHLVVTALGTQTGTYQINLEERRLRMNDAAPLHNASRTGHVADWGDLYIVSLTEHSMQLAVMRDASLAPDGAWWLIYNYISEEYRDNWVSVPPEPALPPGWKDYISQTITVTTSIKWVLSDRNPLDWCFLDGRRMNGWNNLSDYPNWLGTPNPDSYSGFSLTLDSENLTFEYVTPNGATVSGTYGIDDKGIFSFSENLPSFSLVGWASFNTDANNQLRIMSINRDAMGNVSGMWVGAINNAGDEYMAYHLVPIAAGGADTDPTRAWINAFAGKTFVPDIYWFVDWVTISGLPPNLTYTNIGWTGPPSEEVQGFEFGDDYSEGWMWFPERRAVAESASLEFFLEGGQLKLTVTYTRDDETTTETGDVTFDPDNGIINTGVRLVNYGTWGNGLNNQSPTGDPNDWLFVSHRGSNLSTVNQGFWLGRYDSAARTQLIIFRYVLAN